MIRMILAIFATALMSLILNTLYYALTAAGHVFEITRTEPLFGLMSAFHLLLAILLAIALKYVPAGRERSGAIWVGAYLGLASFLPMGLIVRGAWEVPITWYFALDTVIAVVVTAMMGLVFHMIAPSDK